MEYLIGTSGWNYAHWKEKFYHNAPSKDWLKRYAESFNTVEVNNTFYRWPKKEYLKKWVDETFDSFKLTFKIPRSISHSLPPNAEQMQSFYELTDDIYENVGCYLIQFPPRFKNTMETLGQLKEFISRLDKKRHNAIEFRNESWWHKDVYDLFRKNNIAFVSVSGLGQRADILATAKFAYVRCHGRRYDTLYTKDELEKMAAQIRQLPVELVYVYFDNDSNAYAPQNASELKEILRVG